MKIFALALLVAIALGGLVGTLLVRDPGYVLVAYADTVFETSLWVALLLILGLYLLIRGTLFILRKTLQSQGRLLQWRSGRKASAARAQTVRGLLVMAEGRWADAKKLLLGAADNVETPLINYLNAARAAHELGEIDARNGYLKRALETTPSAKFAITLTQAQFNIQDGQYEQALASLLLLRKRAPKQGAVLSMLAKCYEALGDWQALAQMMDDLRKAHALPEPELVRLQRAVWGSLLTGTEKVTSVWKKLPKELRGDASVTKPWIDHLMTSGRDDDAEQAIRLVLEQKWNSDLAEAYGTLASSDPARQLVVAQGWLKERPNDAQIALTVDCVCARKSLNRHGNILKPACVSIQRMRSMVS